MAAVSSMGTRRVPGALPRNVERHFTVPGMLEERTATLRMTEGGSLEGFQSRLGLADGPASPEATELGGSLNRGTYKTTNSVYGETWRAGSGGAAEMAPQSGKENLAGATIGRPITGRDAIELPPSKYPPPTSFPAFPNSPTKALSGQLSPQASNAGRPAQQGHTTQGSTDKASKRYAQPPVREWEAALEQTLDGLAPPTRCNGYGQALSNRAKLAQPAIRGAGSAAEPAPTGTFRVKKIVEEGCNPGASVEHAAYAQPQAPRGDGTYHGSHTGYTSGYARNNPARNVIPTAADAAAQSAVTIEDVHPSVAARLRLRDPVEHAGLLNADEYATTYKHTIDATAKKLTRGAH
ncbi:hypothetical protein KFL_002050180 [Klebsormidium nitens]|uniref:Uncharacterized protein n=1 Tax=Klebsormidium nitens TaxID=105231 RepID=A0A1Y1I1I4_KLENI|nr:hypothetical protein KFL_002050180 [Klebsormidium nitens]|eukprot:GAQ84775.1 hypothetical protein KFL_002050180 [Klebsormidium nitens]